MISWISRSSYWWWWSSRWYQITCPWWQNIYSTRLIFLICSSLHPEICYHLFKLHYLPYKFKGLNFMIIFFPDCRLPYMLILSSRTYTLISSRWQSPPVRGSTRIFQKSRFLKSLLKHIKDLLFSKYYYFLPNILFQSNQFINPFQNSSF